MLFRKKQAEDAPEPAAETEIAGKKHRTPTRKEAQAARHRPLVHDNRKAAKEAERKARNEAYEKQQYALKHSVERDLPPRDKGKARRFARDYIDAGFNMGELFMPVAIVLMVTVLVLSAIGEPDLYFYTTLGMYVIIFASLGHSILEAFRMTGTMKRYFRDDEIPKGTTFYGFQRAFQVRRWRLPRPQVARGEWPQVKMTPLEKD
ncbi:MAG TPA: DUF3043 domain-containing protein [Actinomycetaceae bacterium]|nr:DUF3043 domain-containing protein [Actinomycetaceae bacterium]